MIRPVPTVIGFGSKRRTLEELEQRAKAMEVSLYQDENDGLLQ